MGPKPASKPAPKKAKPVKAARKAPKKAGTHVREITNINSSEVIASGKLSVVYFYGNWTSFSKRLMGVFDLLSIEHKGRVNFFRIDGYSAMRARNLPAVVTGVPTIFFVKGQRYEARAGAILGADAKKELAFFIEEWLDEEDAEDQNLLSRIPLMDPALFLTTVTGPDDPKVLKAGKPAFIAYYDTWVGETAGAFLGALVQVKMKDKSGLAFFKVDADKARADGALPREVAGVPSILLIKNGRRLVHPAYKQKSTDKEAHIKEIKAFVEGAP